MGFKGEIKDVPGKVSKWELAANATTKNWMRDDVEGAMLSSLNLGPYGPNEGRSSMNTMHQIALGDVKVTAHPNSSK